MATRKKKLVFGFKDGSRVHGDPQKVGEELTRIRQQRGALRAPEVVDEARKSGNPLHRYFEWDNRAAADKYREEQARHLIASVVVIQTAEHGEVNPIRAFVKISTEQIDSYEPIATVMGDAGLRERVIREVIEDISDMRRKLVTFETFKDVLEALDTVERVAETHMNGAPAAPAS